MSKGRDGSGFYVQIGTNVSYAAFVEFGTSRMAAKPYLRPALAIATNFMQGVSA
jgi:HK97 gp10 family phage protein